MAVRRWISSVRFLFELVSGLVIYLLRAALLLPLAPFLALGRLLGLRFSGRAPDAEFHVKPYYQGSNQPSAPLKGEVLEPWQGPDRLVGPPGNQYRPVPRAELRAAAERMQELEQEQQRQEYLRSLRNSKA